MCIASRFLPMCAALWSVPCCEGASPLCGAPAGWTQQTSSRMDTPITADKRCGHNSMPPQELISPPSRLLLSPSYCTPLVCGGGGFIWLYTLSSSLRLTYGQPWQVWTGFKTMWQCSLIKSARCCAEKVIHHEARRGVLRVPLNGSLRADSMSRRSRCMGSMCGTALSLWQLKPSCFN